MTAMRQVGATIGVAVLGTVLNSVYASKLGLTGLPRHRRRDQEQRRHRSRSRA